VSWVTDIAELFGSGSVPVVVAGTVLGVFELGERFASQRAKDALSKWLVSFDVQKQKHCRAVRKSFLREFLVSVTFRRSASSDQ
jgi:hypothetical protein